MARNARIAVVIAMMLAVSCYVPPDVVVRPGSNFMKNSSITLTVAGQDSAIFKPELEKELIRRGFNVISESVAKIVSQETKTGDLKAASVASNEGKIDKVAAKAQGDEVTEKSTSTIINSEYVGKIEYIHNNNSYRVSRVNFTIYELKSGTIVVSIGSSAQGYGNSDMARLIVKELEKALGNLN